MVNTLKNDYTYPRPVLLNTINSKLENLPSTLTNMIADTGATTTCVGNDYVHCNIPPTNVKPNPTGIKVLLPKKETITSTHTTLLDINHLPAAARLAHVFPILASGSLLSIGQLCDHGCTVFFIKHTLFIFYKGEIQRRKFTKGAQREDFTNGSTKETFYKGK